MTVSREELEFLVREYHVITENVCNALEELDDEDIPARIRNALYELATAINEEWE